MAIISQSKVTGIDIEVNGKTISLTVHEAEEVCNSLAELFGKDRVFRDGADWIWDKAPGIDNDVWDSAGATYRADFAKGTGRVSLRL